MTSTSQTFCARGLWHAAADLIDQYCARWNITDVFHPLESMVGVVYDPDHPCTLDLDVHLLGIGNVIDRVVTAVMGLLFLMFSLVLIGLGDGRRPPR